MPTYTCECCKYSTHIKTLYTRHIATNKHQTNINKTQSEDEVATSNETTESIEMLFEEIAFLKTELKECKQLIIYMKTYLAYT